MVPVVVVLVGCVVAVLAVVSVIVYIRTRAPVHARGDSEDDEDDNELGAKAGVRGTAETAALMDGEGDSVPDKSGGRADGSWFGFLGSLFQSEKTKSKIPPLMHRKNKSIKKIHKPYFYPLLDETAAWFADWESRKQETSQSTSEVVDTRIEKSSVEDKLNACDLLDGLDCVSLTSFRPTNSCYTVIPIAAV